MEKAVRYERSVEGPAYRDANPNSMLLKGWAKGWKVCRTSALACGDRHNGTLHALQGDNGSETSETSEEDLTAEEKAEDRGMQAALHGRSENYTDASPRLLPAAHIESITQANIQRRAEWAAEKQRTWSRGAKS